MILLVTQPLRSIRARLGWGEGAVMSTEVEGLALGLLTMALSRSPLPPLPHPEDASVDEDIGVSALKAKGCCVQWQLPMPIKRWMLTS